MKKNGNSDSSNFEYGQITEIGIGEIPPVMRGRYLPLFDEIVLRMEVTPRDMGLRIGVKDKKTAKLAVTGLYDKLKSRGIAVVARQDVGGAALFVFRKNGHGGNADE